MKRRRLRAAQIHLVEMKPLARSQRNATPARPCRAFLQARHAILAPVHVEEPRIAALFKCRRRRQSAAAFPL
jgi:hypothetical protein